nr:ATP-binding protein [Tessaracoccus coleopterorum]
MVPRGIPRRGPGQAGRIPHRQRHQDEDLGSPLPTDQDHAGLHLRPHPSRPRDVVAHLGTCTFIAKRENVVLLGPPGTGKTHLAIALGIKAAEASYPVLFDSATGWIHRLAQAHTKGSLERELRRLNRYRLLIIDEVGYLPWTPPQQRCSSNSSPPATRPARSS